VPESTPTLSFTVAFAVVSGAQVVVTELLRVWEPVRWITSRVFDAWVIEHEVGGMKDFFCGTAEQQGADAQAEFRRRRAVVVHIAGLGSEVASLLVGMLASLLALLGSALILANSTASKLWLTVTLVLAAVEVADAILLYKRGAAGTLGEAPVATRRSTLGSYWRDLRDSKTPAPYVATVVLVNIFVVLLGVMLG
jgi:hypothetical protein